MATQVQYNTADMETNLTTMGKWDYNLIANQSPIVCQPSDISCSVGFSLVGSVTVELYDKNNNLIATATGRGNAGRVNVALNPVTEGTAADNGSSAELISWNVDIATFATGKLVIKGSGSSAGGGIGFASIQKLGGGVFHQYIMIVSGGGLIDSEMTFAVS